MNSPTSPFLTGMSRAVLSLALAAVLSACSGGAGGPPEFPPPQVSVALPVQKSVTEWDEYSGIIEAIDAVDIRPRVTGYLRSVHFEEGHSVARDALLFRIDDREYRAAVDSARADLARAESRLNLARHELARSETLVKARAVSEGELDARRGELQQAEADRLAAGARLQQAELTLSFTEIRAPFAGRIGAALIKPGNLVNANQSLLTTVVSLDPVYVAFEGDEHAYLRYQELARTGQRASSREVKNPVRVGLSNENGFPHAGQMVFVDNAVNPATGTIRARARLDNPDGLFTPGLFARVRLLGATRDDALLIHEQAVQTDQDRRYVYVLAEGNVAQRQDVELGPLVDGLRVVESGLSADAPVVVNGMRKIFFPGQPISPQSVPMDQPNLQPAAPEGAANAGGEG